MKQNYPNPFNPSTTIDFTIPENGLVSLKIYNILGQEIATLVNEFLNKGNHSINWNASNMPSGIYFYNISFNNQFKSGRMILMK